jgi:anti-sigma regulatory factor (Ser/Thr protein kinase)
LLELPSGDVETFLVHRDGRQVWVRVTYNRVEDPASGQYKIVGTMRDVTAEHHAARREGALAGLAEQLARAQTGADTLRGAAVELARIFTASQVVLAAFGQSPGGPDAEPDLVCSSDQTEWGLLPGSVQERVRALSQDPEGAGWVGAEPGVESRSESGSSPGPGAGAGSGEAFAAAAGFPGGVLVAWVAPSPPGPGTDEELRLLSRLVARLAEGMARVSQIDGQRETALALQHAILGPDILPPGFAARYQPSASPLQVGGDWYDTVPLPDGRIGIVVGDCVGHGLAAAAVMGQLRSACRSLLLEHTDPVRVLAGLDRFAALLPGAECTTVLAAVLDPASGAVDYSAAGHPPPILALPDGSTMTLEDGRGLPVGVRPDRPRHLGRAVLPPRASLLLYTDGLVERRRRSIDEGIDRAAAVLHEQRAQSVEGVAEAVTAALKPPGGYEDDVALLLYRHPGPLDVEFTGTGELTEVRSRLRAWLGQCGLAPQQVLDVLIAAGEACANALEHGHRNLGAVPIRLQATALPGQLHLQITDSGTWKTADPHAPGQSLRGRGIGLMRAVMQQVTITPGPEGTIVDMHARIPA